MWSNFSRLLAAALLIAGVVLIQGQTARADSAAAAQNPAPSKPQFFSGVVTTLDTQHITVSRTLIGKPAETRTFTIKPSTKLAKSVKAKAKVTVRYRHEKDDGDVALEIQTRSSWRFSRS